MIGTTLNHYRIVGRLGAGGMGEVYTAEDTKLHRRIAIKVLPVDVADEPERRTRFEREAHMLAALNHPNIVTIYSIERTADRQFVTMELVEGRPLSVVVPQHGLPLERLLTLAIPLADAVSAAHAHGITHRDLKPANIMVTDDGRLKVLDFGVAQLTHMPRDTDSATTVIGARLTGDQQVIGTIAYMSPEQAEGRNLDHRSDIFSLGIVLYEMATGEHPFKGDTAMSQLSSIVKDTPVAVTSINPALPSEFARIVRRCLAKDLERRYQSAADVRNDLEELKHELSVQPGRTAARPHTDSRRRRREWVMLAAVALVLLIGVAAAFMQSRSIDRSADIVSLLPPANTMIDEGDAPVLSPDGRMVAFVATDDSGRTWLYLRRRESLDARPLPGTDDATQPFWSPDSRSIGFFATGQLKRIDIGGSRPQALAPASVPRGGTWNRDGVILFVPHPQQMPHHISAEGGTATPLRIGSGYAWFPSFLPDGRRFIYLVFRSGVPRGIYVGSLDSTETTPLAQAPTSAIYLEPGYLAFRRDGALFAQRLDLEHLRLEGAAIALADSVSFNPITLQTLFSGSTNGELAYLGAGRRWQLTWFDRLGRRLTSAGAIGGYNSLCLSSDGRTLVYDAADTASGNVDIYSLNLNDGRNARLTFSPEQDFYAACSPIDNAIIFSSPRQDAPPSLHRVTPEAPGHETLLHRASMPSLPTDWSGGGRHLVYSVFSDETNWDIWVERPDNGDAFPYLTTDIDEQNGHLSPDGRWMAYTSGQAGTYEVYVQPFPATGSKWQVSRGGGRQPQWDPQGRQLYYISPDKKLMAVDVDTMSSAFVIKGSRLLIDTRVGGWERTHQGNPYAITSDGERLLVANADDDRLTITLVLNWSLLSTSASK